MDVLIQELANALESVMNVIDTVHDNGENCPYCGAEYETHTPRDTEEVECPSEDCIGKDASEVLIKVRALCKRNLHKFEYAYDLNYDATGNVASVADQYRCARCGAIDIVE